MSEVNVLTEIFRKLANWQNFYVKNDLDGAAKALTSKYRMQIYDGKNADGSDMKPLRPATLKGPVRRDGNTQIRESLGATPLFATGKTADSIQGVRTGDNEWTIASDSSHGAAVLESNAKTSHGGFPFYGDVQKPVRDPLTVAEPQLDYIEEDLVKSLEKLLSSI